MEIAILVLLFFSKQVVISICNFSHKNIILITLIISIIIFIFLNQTFFINQNQIFENSLEKIIPDNIEIELKIPNNNIIEPDKNQNIVEDELNIIHNIWQIEIPKINLIAPISDGTSTNIMNKYVGHFDETPKDKGNIGLAAHNRGYPVNYFQNLKLLQSGDLIIYTYNGEISKYSVSEIGIIKDTDWSKLENGNQDKITLITCVENEPEYRRYVQAIKWKGEN